MYLSPRASLAPLPIPAGDACVDDPSPPTPPVAIQVEGEPPPLRLKFTEDATGYGVTAECEEALSNFEVEAEDHAVFIHLIEDRTHAPSGGSIRLRPASRRSTIALSFGEPIDASASQGECDDRRLRLSLRKRLGGPAGGLRAAPCAR